MRAFLNKFNHFVLAIAIYGLGLQPAFAQLTPPVEYDREYGFDGPALAPKQIYAWADKAAAQAQKAVTEESEGATWAGVLQSHLVEAFRYVQGPNLLSGAELARLATAAMQRTLQDTTSAAVKDPAQLGKGVFAHTFTQSFVTSVLELAADLERRGQLDERQDDPNTLVKLHASNPDELEIVEGEASKLTKTLGEALLALCGKEPTLAKTFAKLSSAKSQLSDFSDAVRAHLNTFISTELENYRLLDAYGEASDKAAFLEEHFTADKLQTLKAHTRVLALMEDLEEVNDELTMRRHVAGLDLRMVKGDLEPTLRPMGRDLSAYLEDVAQTASEALVERDRMMALHLAMAFEGVQALKRSEIQASPLDLAVLPEASAITQPRRLMALDLSRPRVAVPAKEAAPSFAKAKKEWKRAKVPLYKHIPGFARQVSELIRLGKVTPLAQRLQQDDEALNIDPFALDPAAVLFRLYEDASAIRQQLADGDKPNWVSGAGDHLRRNWKVYCVLGGIAAVVGLLSHYDPVHIGPRGAAGLAANSGFLCQSGSGVPCSQIPCNEDGSSCCFVDPAISGVTGGPNLNISKTVPSADAQIVYPTSAATCTFQSQTQNGVQTVSVQCLDWQGYQNLTRACNQFYFIPALDQDTEVQFATTYRDLFPTQIQTANGYIPNPQSDIPKIVRDFNYIYSPNSIKIGEGENKFAKQTMLVVGEASDVDFNQQGNEYLALVIANVSNFDVENVNGAAVPLNTPLPLKTASGFNYQSLASGSFQSGSEDLPEGYSYRWRLCNYVPGGSTVTECTTPKEFSANLPFVDLDGAPVPNNKLTLKERALIPAVSTLAGLSATGLVATVGICVGCINSKMSRTKKHYPLLAVLSDKHRWLSTKKTKGAKHAELEHYIRLALLEFKINVKALEKACYDVARSFFKVCEEIQNLRLSGIGALEHFTKRPFNMMGRAKEINFTALYGFHARSGRHSQQEVLRYEGKVVARAAIAKVASGEADSETPRFNWEVFNNALELAGIPRIKLRGDKFLFSDNPTFQEGLSLTPLQPTTASFGDSNGINGENVETSGTSASPGTIGLSMNVTHNPHFKAINGNGGGSEAESQEQNEGVNILLRPYDDYLNHFLSSPQANGGVPLTPQPYG